MNSQKYFMHLIAVVLATGAIGVAHAAKCGTALAFTFDPGTAVNAGTDVTMTEEVTTTTAGSGSQACGLVVGSHVTAGNAAIAAVTLGPDGPGRTCSDLANNKKYCTTGISANADNSCTLDSDCVTDPLGNGVCTAVTTTQVAHENPADGTLAYGPLDTSALGGQTLGYRASYQGGGNFENAVAICTDLTVNEVEACSGATIGIDLATGPGAPAPGGPYNWSYRVTVHACEDLFGVTAQGGTNGWAQLVGRSATSLHPSNTTTAEIRNPNKKTDVILWTIGNMTAGQTETLVVDLSGSIPAKTPDCQVRYLSGPWSALFSTDGIAFDKTDYTGRVSVQVDSDGDPDNCP